VSGVYFALRGLWTESTLLFLTELFYFEEAGSFEGVSEVCKTCEVCEVCEVCEFCEIYEIGEICNTCKAFEVGESA